MKRPTIRDVAKRAGVSTATVSHVINDTRFVEQDTKQRVLHAIEELKYRPSSVARSLTTNRTETVGVIIPDATNHFFGEVLRGIEDTLLPENYALFVCNTAETIEREAHYLDLLLRQRVDAIIAASTTQRWDVLTTIEKEHVPIVYLDRCVDNVEGPFVGVNNWGGAYLGTSYLIDCGHRRLGILAGFQGASPMRERLAGFRKALEANAIPLPEERVIVTSQSSIEEGCRAMLEMLALPERPSAVFVNNNVLTLGALMAIRQIGVHCPEDISLVTFDDPQWAAVSDPPLTVIRQPTDQIGQVAAQMLLALLKGDQPVERHVTLECELIVRQSTCVHER